MLWCLKHRMMKCTDTVLPGRVLSFHAVLLAVTRHSQRLQTYHSTCVMPVDLEMKKFPHLAEILVGVGGLVSCLAAWCIQGWLT